MGTRKLSEGGPVHTSQNRKGGQTLDIVKRIMVELWHKERRRSDMEMDCGFCLVRNDGLYKNGVKVNESGEEQLKRFAGAIKEAMETAWIIDDGALKTPLKMVKLKKEKGETNGNRH